MSKDVSLDPIGKLLVGVNKVADAVGGTLGPKGLNVFLDTVPPRITNDGKTIADAIDLEDRHENLGAWLVKNTAAQQVDAAGDGSSTASLLVREIVKESLKRPENKMAVAQSLKAALPGVIKAIVQVSRPLKDIKQVALISAEDDVLATNIAELVEKVGATGTIRVEENYEPEISYEVVDGYEANVGYLSPVFINNRERLTAEFDNAPVFCSAKKIGAVGDIAKLFEDLQANKINQIVIVAEEIEQEILGLFAINKQLGRLQILAIRATGPLLEDIAASVGATLVADNTGISFDNFDVKEHMGQAKVISSEKKTVFLSKNNKAKEQADRLSALADMNPNKWEADRSRDRAAKLRKGIAVLRIGSYSTVDMTYLLDKADDAVHATQAALEEGIVEGGGMCLWRIAQEMEPKTVGEEVLKKALCSPLKQICENAGKEYAEVVRQLQDNQGYNAKDDVTCDMFASGIVDPAKVERTAVTNALLNAAQFITTHAAVIDVPKSNGGGNAQ
jgi:chaperonin GroEL